MNTVMRHLTLGRRDDTLEPAGLRRENLYTNMVADAFHDVFPVPVPELFTHYQIHLMAVRKILLHLPIGTQVTESALDFHDDDVTLERDADYIDLSPSAWYDTEFSVHAVSLLHQVTDRRLRQLGSNERTIYHLVCIRLP